MKHFSNSSVSFRLVAIAVISTVFTTALVVIEPDVGTWTAGPPSTAFADPLPGPSAITLTADLTDIAPGQSATLTATTDVDVSGTGNTVRIVDQTTGVTLKACTSGSTCTVTSTFQNGGPHTYVATVGSLTSTSVIVSRAQWAITLTSDKTTFVAGEAVTLSATANYDVAATGASFRIYIFDATLGTLLASCNTGSVCVSTRTPPFQSGASHAYVAMVAKAATPTYASVQDVQATSNSVSLSRTAWTATLTTNKAQFAAGETVTLTATLNQSIVSSSPYRLYIFDTTTGARKAYCTSGTTCSVSSSSLFVSGAPHEYVAVVASANASTYSALVDTQAQSNPVTVSRQTWTISLSQSATEFAATQSFTLTATTNQSVASTSSTYRIYIFDLTAGTRLATCSSGTSCSTTTRFYNGGPHEYVAVVAATGTPSSYGEVMDTQATSSIVSASRKPWTISLATNRSYFSEGQYSTITATANQSVNNHADSYQLYMVELSTGTVIATCDSGATCAVNKLFKTGGPRSYVAYVARDGTPVNVSEFIDIQAISNSVEIARLPWDIGFSVSQYSWGPIKPEIDFNQSLNDVSAFYLYIVDVTDNEVRRICSSMAFCDNVLSETEFGHTYCAILASELVTTAPFDDIQTAACGTPFSQAPAPEEDAGGANPSENDCTCDHADPVNSATGEFYLPAMDLEIAGSGAVFGLSRTYSTTYASNDSPFGFGWSANFSSKLNVVTPGDSIDPLPRQVEIVQENGSKVFFNEEFGQHYTAPPRVHATLIFDAVQSEWIFTRNSNQVLVFDADGVLLRVEDQNHNVTSFTYDSEGNLSTIAASGGRSISLTWSGGRVSQAVDSTARVVSYSYDSAGNLTSVTSVDGSVSSYTYNSLHLMTSLVAPGGGTTSNSFDSAKRVVSQTDPIGRVTGFSYSGFTTTITAPDGSLTTDTYTSGKLTSQTRAASTALAATTTYTYDDAGNLLSTTDPIGSTTTFTYDADGNMLTKTDPLGRITQWTYDDQRHPTTVIDALNRVTTMTYDSVGNLTLITFPSGKQSQWTFNADGTVATATNASGQVTTYEYDAAGRMTSATDPDGRTTSLGYNAAGIVSSQTAPGGAVTMITPDATGRPLTVTDPNGQQTTYTYNTAGDVTQVTDALGNSTSATYDAAGQVLTATDAAGKVTAYTYTAAGQRASVTDPNGHTTSSVYDALGRVISTTDPLSRTTTFAYDLASQLLSTTRPSGAVSSVVYDAAGQVSSATNALGQTTTFAYNLVGQLVSTTDPLGRVTATAYDSDGRVDTITLPDASTQQYDYNADGQPVAFTNGDGGVTTYGYSNAGMLLGKSEPGGLTTSYAYDAAGRPSVVTDPDSSTATYAYDLRGQLLSVDYSATSGVESTYTYDALGRPLTMTDASGVSSFAYDVVGRLVSETNGAGNTTGYGYDDAGQLTTITYPGSRAVVYGHDAAGQMTSMTDWSTNTTAFTYTADGQLATQVTPDGVAQSNAYDAAGQLTSIAHMSGLSTLASFDYAYDAAGQLTGNSSTLDGVAIASDYGYNPISQLASVTTTPSPGTASAAPLEATPAGLLTTTVNGSVQTYNSAQQVTTSTPLLATPTTFAYDARGARVSATTGADVASYAYSPAGALASATTPFASVSYTSDARNLRQSRTEGGETRQFTWSGVGGLPLLLDDGQDSYLYGPSSTPLAQVDDASGEVEYLHADLLGSPRMVTDDAGVVVGTTTFDAFGTAIAQSGVQSAFGFTGNLVDAVTGLLYLRARDYDAQTGQFLTVDPLVDRTRQPYAYAGNNPVTRVDPSGLDWEWLEDVWRLDMIVLATIFSGGQAAEILASKDDEAGIFGGWLLNLSGPTTTYGEGTGLVDDMRCLPKVVRQRAELQGMLGEGATTGTVDASYSAGKPFDPGSPIMEDLQTFANWGTSDAEHRLMLALGSYELQGSIVSVGDHTAVVEWSGQNTTRLGSLLHLNDDFYNFFNDFSEATGFFPQKTQVYSWTETVTF